MIQGVLMLIQKNTLNCPKEFAFYVISGVGTNFTEATSNKSNFQALCALGLVLLSKQHLHKHPQHLGSPYGQGLLREN